MADIRDQNFTGGERVDTDGNRYFGCNFQSATLVYAGGEHPWFDDCTFGDVGWYFSGAALRTIQLLQTINNTGGDNGNAFVTDLFKPGNMIGE